MGAIITVNFRGDELYGFENDDGTFVALKPIVEAMGLDWDGQRQRVKRDPVLSEGACMMHVPFGRGGPQETLCLKFELVNGWLFTVDSSRIKDETVRERVLLYQRECYAVLCDHFAGKRKGVIPKDAEPDTEEPMDKRRQLVTEARQTWGHQAAREIWFEMGLPIVPAMLAAPVREQQSDLFASFPALKSTSGAA